ncbi:MAG TPA: hypothetical protein VH062_15640 [Polyangiaceae bacterium]|nr:hypothetical protein [Polyangiaceae bacterium]
MNVVRITLAASVLTLALGTGACSSSGSSSPGADGGNSTGADGGVAGEGGTSAPVSTCSVSDEGDGCHDTSCPCTLLTQDQVNAALGVTVGTPDDGTGTGGDPHSCIWTYKAAAPSTDKVTLYLTTNIDPPSFAGACGGKASPGKTVVPASGIGDTACYTVIADGFGTDLSFQKNCWAYELSISATGTLTSMFTQDTIEADEKALALQIASKY